ncbi:hypothetical protein P3T73_07470 [Kiritimatiellota bacterium B12222]|nr:hypothetical protein P3T73_07470 [Kiritimatiellota bacterium B12222]
MSEESEKSENPDAPKPEELQSLFGSFDLTPDWAKGKPGVTQSEPTHRSKGGGRGRDGGGRPRVPKSSRPNMQGVRVKPRRTPQEGGGRGEDFRDNNSRGPRGEGGYGGQRYQERAPRVPVHVDFIPEKKRLSKVVKVIRQSHRAFPLKVVAGKFMEKASFISMKYTVKDNVGEDATDFHLFVCTANGMVFSDQQACEQYILNHGMEATYEREDREIAPPAGNFVCVGRHGRSGRLVGPPNWHGYQTRLEALRSEVAEDMPLEMFSRQIEMSHDEADIEAWKKDVSVQSFYRKKREEKPAPAAEEKAAEVVAEEAPVVPEVSEVPADAGAETADAPVAEETVVAESPVVEGEGVAETSVAAEETAEEAPVAEAEATPVEDNRPYDWTREEAEADFRQHHMPKLIKKTKRAIMPGYLFDKMSDPGLLSLTKFHLNREHDRPNSIIFALRPAFKHMRLHVFRHHGELMVSGIAQHPLPDDLKVVDEIRHIIDYVAANPGCNTQVALQAVAKQDGEIPADLVSHFRWMIEKGHLVEMHDDTLQLPHASGKK